MFGGTDLVCSPCLRLQQANKFSAIGAAETVLAIASEARDAYVVGAGTWSITAADSKPRQAVPCSSGCGSAGRDG